MAVVIKLDLECTRALMQNDTGGARV